MVNNIKKSDEAKEDKMQTSLFQELKNVYQNKAAVSSVEGCGGQCGVNTNGDMCCTKVSMLDKDGSLVKTSYKCMKRSVTDLFDGFQVDGMYFKY